MVYGFDQNSRVKIQSCIQLRKNLNFLSLAEVQQTTCMPLRSVCYARYQKQPFSFPREELKCDKSTDNIELNAGEWH